MIRIVPIPLRWSNAYLLIGQSVILVDTGTVGDYPRIEAAIHRKGISPDEIEWILHTHGHPDHCGNTAEFKTRFHTKTAIHHLDEPLARSPENIDLKPVGIAGRILLRLIRLPAVPFIPDRLLDGDEPLKEFGTSGQIVHTPGHTPGSLSIIVNGVDAIAGDLLMGGCLGGKVLPRIPRFHYFADDLGQARLSVARLLNMDVQRFHVGHGGPLRRMHVTDREHLYGRNRH